ncbi:MAG: hypothetical protein M3280_07735 [Actinomycetota bacterium]|nr:hypothetical protein [Actinomycetota bacterium]
MSGVVAMIGVMIVITGITIYLVGSLVRSIQDQSRPQMKIWKNFGLSLGFCTLFFLSWVGQGIAQWQEFTDDQAQHGGRAEVGDFVAEFSARTLENWQSEFLQLFSFTVMSALLIHKGSAESKDSDEDMKQALRRIEDKLGTK